MRFCVFILNHQKKKNRGQKIYSSPVQQYAESSNLKLRYPSDLNEEEYQYIKNLKPAISYSSSIWENFTKKNIRFKRYRIS